MTKNYNFVFASRKRWIGIKIFVVILAVVLGFVGFGIFQSLTNSPFPEIFPKEEVTSIINQIATRKPEKIEIQGSGPILQVKNVNSEYFLKRLHSPNHKKVLLTFDDGPNPIYTRKILDVLAKENVKATFFVTGENFYKYPEIGKEIIHGGHLIGVHTFTHTPEDRNLYDKNLQMFLEFELTQRVIEDTTGFSTKIFRLPYWGTEETLSMNNLVLTINAAQRGYQIVGSTIDSLDWQAKTPTEILENIRKGRLEDPVILLHDGGGERKNTVEALPQIVSHYKKSGFQFETVDKLFPNQEILAPLNLKEKFYAKTAILFYSFLRSLPSFSSSVFILGLAIFVFHSIFVSFFAIIHKLREKNFQKFGKNLTSQVSVVIPAYNEEKVIEKTVNSVLSQDYENFEVIVVDDSSTDNTAKEVGKFLSNHRVKLVQQENSGKFAALNSGFAQSSGEIVVAIDADTQIVPLTISKFVRHFQNKKIGAVAGNVKVGNQTNLLTFLQELDYRMAINLERRAFDFLDSVFVVPGAVGAWRKAAVVTVGGFSNLTLTEDAELGLRLKKAGFKIAYEPAAVGFTEAPTNLPGLVHQRFRWTFGMLQSLWLHKDIIFRAHFGIFGVFILPYTIFIQLPAMALAPIIELMVLPLVIFGFGKLVLFGLLVLLGSRFMLFALASNLAEEDLSLAAFILPFRFFYQFLWYFILDFAILIALKGSVVAWEKLPHLGMVNLSKLKLAQPILVPQVSNLANE